MNTSLPDSLLCYALIIAVFVVAIALWLLLKRMNGRSFARMLPRLYELRAMLSDPAHPNAYFPDFEQSLAHPSVLAQFQRLEADLAALDRVAWGDLKSRAARHLISQTRDHGRGWQALFDCLNEAKGYGYLKTTGCTDIRFIPQATAKTPDLEATLSGRRVLCEVKTFNISEQEAERKRPQRRDIKAFKVPTQLDDAFLTGKLLNTLTHAAGQLDAEDPGRMAERIIFAVFHADDWVGDYLPEYMAQIDQHLQQHPIPGARIVFCVRDIFDRSISMKSAQVVSV